MKTRWMIAAAALAVSGVGLASDDTNMVALNKDDVKWGAAPPVLPKGAQAAVLQGDPMGKSKQFAIRIKTPKDEYRVMPHSHPTDEIVTVLSGTFYAGMGDHFDAGQAKAYKEGSFLVMPKGVNHFAYTKGETVIQVQGEAPFEFKYVNPKDDPRKQGVGGAGEQGTEQQSTGQEGSK